MVDLATQSTSEKSKSGVRMPITSASGAVLVHQAKGDKNPREMFLVLKGPESVEARRYVKQVQNRNTRRGKHYTPSNEDMESEVHTDSVALAGMVVDGLVFYENKWVELTKENAYEILFNVELVRNQAGTFVFDHGNFTKA